MPQVGSSINLLMREKKANQKKIPGEGAKDLHRRTPTILTVGSRCEGGYGWKWKGFRAMGHLFESGQRVFIFPRDKRAV